jgi:hypothetical protein
VKEALIRQAEKEVNSLKKKLEATQQKAKDAANDLRAVVDGTFVRSLSVIFETLAGLWLILTFDVCRFQGDGGCPQEGARGDQGSGDGP